MDKDYYSKVVELLVNYKKNKQRLKVLELDYDQSPYDNISVDFGTDITSSMGSSDRTGNKALQLIEEKKDDKELNDLWQKVAYVELSFMGLSKVEKFIIKHKYLDGEIKQDVDIYCMEESPVKRSKYYEVKDQAVKKMAEIMGFI